MDTALVILAILGAIAITFVLFLGLVWFGFRMGRMSIDKPLPPIIQEKPEPFVEEDPWFEPMHGKPGIEPTVEDKR